MATQAEASRACGAVLSLRHTRSTQCACLIIVSPVSSVLFSIEDDLYADLICDGFHVAPEAVRLWLKMKGPERAILITDCLSAAGRPNGTYMTGDTIVHVEGDACRTNTGVLAGSIITLDRAVANLRKIARADVHSAARLASVNPTRMLGFPEPLGTRRACRFQHLRCRRDQATVFHSWVIDRMK